MSFCVECYCSVCKASDAAALSEERRNQLAVLYDALRANDGKATKYPITNKFVPSSPASALRKAEGIVQILKEEGLLGMCLANAYRQCSRFSLEEGMIEKAKAYALKELEVERSCLGLEADHLVEGGNAHSWMQHIQATAEKQQDWIKMCEKRIKKEQKRIEKKAVKKGSNGGS